MGLRQLRLVVIGVAIVAGAVYGARTFMAGGASVALIGISGILGLVFVVTYVAASHRDQRVSRILGMVGAAIAWSLAFLAYVIRSLCWGDPDPVLGTPASHTGSWPRWCC